MARTRFAGRWRVGPHQGRRRGFAAGEDCRQRGAGVHRAWRIRPSWFPCWGKFPLPVEVIKMALPVVEPRLAELGFTPKLRMKKDSSGTFLTDEGNYILDCWSAGIAEPESTAAEIRSIVGVVEHGLFLGMATLALVAATWDEGVAGLGGPGFIDPTPAEPGRGS